MTRQRIVLATGAVAVLATLVFPPFHLQLTGGVVVNQGYAWLWTPPSNGAATLNATVLVTEWIGIAAICAALFVALRPRRPRSRGSRPTEWELQAMLTHVAYEAAALELSASRYLAGPNRRQAFEAFLIHARQLREFYRKKWRPADPYGCSLLLAEHYFAAPAAWHGARGSEPDILRETKDAVDKQLAHISRFRANPAFTTDLEKKVPEILAALQDQWARFQKALPDAPFGKALKTEFSAWKAKL